MKNYSPDRRPDAPSKAAELASLAEGFVWYVGVIAGILLLCPGFLLLTLLPQALTHLVAHAIWWLFHT